MLFRTSSDTKVGEGVKACFVDGNTGTSAYWQVVPVGENIYTLQVPVADASYVEGEYLGTQSDHRNDAYSPTDGIYSDVTYLGHEKGCQWAFITLDDMKAAEELELSGYKPGDLNFKVMVDKEFKKTAALILQEDLDSIGIGLELEELETAALKGRLNDAALDYELCLYQWTDADGTDFTVRNMYGSFVQEDGTLKKNVSNRANLKDAKLNEMIEARTGILRNRKLS